MTGSAIGLLVGATAGGIWCAAGSAGMPAGRRGATLIASVAITAALMWKVVTSSRLPSSAFDGEIYGAACAIESAAIVVAVLWLRRLRRADLIPPVVAAIVGLHFLGLFFATHLLVFVVVAIGMTLAGVVLSTLRSLTPEGRLAMTGVLSAVILWLACTATLLHSGA